MPETGNGIGVNAWENGENAKGVGDSWAVAAGETPAAHHSAMNEKTLDTIRATPARNYRERRQKRQTLDRLEAKIRAKRRKVEAYELPF